MNDSETEILELSITISDLLKRIENGMLQQQKFHSDASYELKTSATIIRGTLEVLTRRRRDTSVYEDRIKEIIRQVDSMITVIDQAFVLSWLSSNEIIINEDIVNLNCLLDILEDKWLSRLHENHMCLRISVPYDKKIITDCYLLELILDRLISNSIRQDGQWNSVYIAWDEQSAALSISDTEFHVPAKYLNIMAGKGELNNSDTLFIEAGHRLAMAIVTKAASLLHLNVTAPALERNHSFSLQFTPANFLSET